MLVEPYALMNEHADLMALTGENRLADLYIEEGAVIITPFHWIANRIRERRRGANRHGSCGFGVGEARADQLDNQPVITAGELRRNWQGIYEKLVAIRDRKYKEFEDDELADDFMKESLFSIGYFYESFANKVQIVPNGSLSRMLRGPVVFEGAQGMLLDEQYGFAPHNTWTDITFRNADNLLHGIDIAATRIGVLRTYFTRHGAGPFPTEDPTMSLEDHNHFGEWQGAFRFGKFDLPMAEYAVESIGGVDGIALTHLDQTDDKIIMPGGGMPYGRLEAYLKAPIVFEARGPSSGYVIQNTGRRVTA